MAAIAKRISSLEADVERMRRRKLFIPVLFVTEYPEGIYTGRDGAIFNSDAELQRFADEHGTVAIINDDTKLKKEQETSKIMNK